MTAVVELLGKYLLLQLQGGMSATVRNCGSCFVTGGRGGREGSPVCRKTD